MKIMKKGMSGSMQVLLGLIILAIVLFLYYNIAAEPTVQAGNFSKEIINGLKAGDFDNDGTPDYFDLCPIDARQNPEQWLKETGDRGMYCKIPQVTKDTCPPYATWHAGLIKGDMCLYTHIDGLNYIVESRKNE